MIKFQEYRSGIFLKDISIIKKEIDLNLELVALARQATFDQFFKKRCQCPQFFFLQDFVFSFQFVEFLFCFVEVFF